MTLPKKYVPSEIEPRLQDLWEEAGVNHFQNQSDRPVYSIDTPPPTVSGKLHLGHTYSYTHTDVFARFRRMRGDNVFYPMGYDDNGLPTERLVERLLGTTASEIGQQAFIEKCLQLSQQAELEYQQLWQRLGLSMDPRYTYRTIDDLSQRTSQLSFIDLYNKDLVYRQEAPAIWCPECQTAIAQADVDDLEREGVLVTLAFQLENGESIPIATTRPELLPACVAAFVHPDDQRFQEIVGREVRVPLFDQVVEVMQDPATDPEKGTGVVMCCTFGDTMDKHWWYTYHLPHIQAIDRQGRMTEAGGDYAGLPISEARQAIIAALEQEGYLLERTPAAQIVPIHERCDTPVEFIMSQQWFIRLLDHKDELLAAGERISWHPEHMKARYLSWVENLAWDWCISRQRYHGVHFPLWYCLECGEIILAEEEQLPVNPSEARPIKPCQCGSENFQPEQDIFDTWATSSMTPQIVGRWLEEDGLYQQVFPFSLRPQAHEIIRTWAFYTIAKSHYHFQELPWKEVVISGWGIAGEGQGKISKSRGGGPIPPLEMIERYSADAVRYWAVSTGLGKDALISEDKIKMGAKLVTKLWNVARFSERFLLDRGSPLEYGLESNQIPLPESEALSPADHWILSRNQRLVHRVTELLMRYDYAAAKSEIENFFWSEFADNYLEMCKQRLYGEDEQQKEAARFTLHNVLLSIVKLFAPFLPHITEAIYQELFVTPQVSEGSGFSSIHNSRWPVPMASLEDDLAEQLGVVLVQIATSVRRYKSENGLALGTEFHKLQLAPGDDQLIPYLENGLSDLISITRAREIEVADQIDPTLTSILNTTEIKAAIEG